MTKTTLLVALVLTTSALRAEKFDEIVTVRKSDGLIQVFNHNGVLLRKFGKSSASGAPKNFRVDVGNVLGRATQQIITATADHLDPCRRLYDAKTGSLFKLAWSREGRFALDVAASEHGVLTINEKRPKDQPKTSYWNAYSAIDNERLFHTDFGIDVVRIAAGELVASSPGSEIVTVDHKGQLVIWDGARKRKDPIVLSRIESNHKHVDVAIGDVVPSNPGNEIICCNRKGWLLIRTASGKLLRSRYLGLKITNVAVANVSPKPGNEVLGITDKGMLVFASVAKHPHIYRLVNSDAERHPLSDVASIGPTKPFQLSSITSRWSFGPVSPIRRGKQGDHAWRVRSLTNKNAGAGLVNGYTSLFTIPNYWPYAVFTSHTSCKLPGKQFVAHARGTLADREHFMTPSFWGHVNRYQMVDGKLYIASRMAAPTKPIEGGRYCEVRPSTGPWSVWCNRRQHKIVWTVEYRRKGKLKTKELVSSIPKRSWHTMQVIAEPQQLALQFGSQQIRVQHDSYEQPFYVRFGSQQTKPGGAEVVSHFREVYVSDQPYPLRGLKFASGPEDLRTTDNGVVGFIQKAKPKSPRSSEGDMIVTRKGHLLAVYSFYYAGKGHDGSPARLVARVSKDQGKTWSKKWTVADRDKGSQGNVMSGSLLRAKNGDLLLAYYDRTPDMPAKAMVLRRSADEGKTWSNRVVVSPKTGHRHAANNACLIRHSSGRILLAAREYIGGIRWPYASYSDDDGRTWKAGAHVPDPGLTPSQKRGQNVNEPSICELADGRLLMTMRSVAGGQFFSWSKDRGETWTKPILSPLRGQCSPAILRRIPNSKDILAIWTYGFSGRTPLVSAISSDGGKTWKHLKLVEQSVYHGYCYASCVFQKGRVHLGYMYYPSFSSRFRFEADPGYIDYRFVSLPLEWFYRPSR